MEVKEAYVDYRLGKLLKSRGFDEPCEYYIVPEGLSGKMIGCDNMKEPHKKLRNSELNFLNDAVSCPTIQMVISWLQTKGCYLNVESRFAEDFGSLGTTNVAVHTVIIRAKNGRYTGNEYLNFDLAVKETIESFLLMTRFESIES